MDTSLDEIGSTRPATNFPRISVDSNRVDCLVEKGDIGVEPRRLQSAIRQGLSAVSGCSPVASALRSGPRGLYNGINFRLTSGCSAVASALRSGRRGRRFKSSHPDHILYEISCIKYHIQGWSLPLSGDSTLKTMNPFGMAPRLRGFFMPKNWCPALGRIENLLKMGWYLP